MKSILKTQLVNKFFHDPNEFHVLKDISIEVDKGELVTLVGKSGCGKSTLLYILSTMDRDYKGDLYLDNELMTHKSIDELAAIRNEKIGFVFQFHYLLQEFSCLKNVMIPALRLGKLSPQEIEAKAYERLKTLGLADQALKNASKLSGGQQQRVAIARALINDPLIIMGDEPTGNLDSKNTAIVFEIFKDLAHNAGQTIIAVTHDEDFAQKSDRIIEMKDGMII
ncbi:ABC transporter ATP-binding protein [Pedobacter changchengzhani]|uniref:ABC transporter ATP-binding protein n=1 Tax=Pedobacter changchengzhani TaxID=2529274 RepID=A0A4R5MIV6_9SPHI|nr:ABC transporter ATP-binding protein [Pedobacter changchengzhani]TDG35567.1 ABC transporter ATP-binding protein [Pedobacter changchengzhani]